MADVTLPIVAVLLAALAIAAPLARWLGIGSVLGYLIAGVLLGPYGLTSLFSTHEAKELLHVAEFGIILLLFLIGLELRPRRLWAMRNAIFGLGGAQVGISALLLGAAAVLFGLPWHTALFAGLAPGAVVDGVCAAGAGRKRRTVGAAWPPGVCRPAFPGPRRHPAHRARAIVRSRRRHSRNGLQGSDDRARHHRRRRRGWLLPARSRHPVDCPHAREGSNDCRRSADGRRRRAYHAVGWRLGVAGSLHRRPRCWLSRPIGTNWKPTWRRSRGCCSVYSLPRSACR